MDKKKEDSVCGELTFELTGIKPFNLPDRILVEIAHVTTAMTLEVGKCYESSTRDLKINILNNMEEFNGTHKRTTRRSG